MSSPMDDLCKPCDFSNIVGYPHDLPDKAIENLPSFQDNNAISAKYHITKFNQCLAKWCNAHNYEDVKMKLFILSLEDDAMEWFQDQNDNKFKTVKEIIEAFNDRWGDRSDNHFLLAALHTSQKQESETMEEFNKRFNDLVKSLPADIKPREASLLIYYIQALEGEMNYQIRNKEPVNLKDAQEKAIKIEKNMQDLGKSNVLGFSMDSPLESDKVKKVENQEPQGDSIDKLTQLIKQMEVNHANQIAAM